MKRWMRLAAVQTLLAVLTAGYLRLLMITLRWRREGLEARDALLASPEGLIVLFWHGRIVTAAVSRGLLGDKPRYALVSLSRDGGFIARAAAWVGVPTIRGSTARIAAGGDGVASKGGAQAFWALLQAVREGAAALVTPDGPRGPKQRMSEGAVRLARLTGAPVMLCGFDSAPAIAPRSWDAARIPLPFSRAALVADGPLRIAPDADDATVEATRQAWEARLNAAQARAGALLGRPA
ncbi:lysophospholipid acyltransferase family protein [Caulobacter sp. KR2-114]|uniref:lysophospholipid acyltransferase family protein n=1 Tax=Caulobacter sp. KR2-114 TaxID=3400912 RepID=UPI003C0B2A59